MSIQVLIEVQKEIRRLSIAGSDLCVDDFRIKKLLPSMQKSGESVPVFKKVSELLEKAITPSGDKTSQNLLELATLVNAVLYTQGETTVNGEIEEIKSTPVEFKTVLTYRRLKPVIEALTTKGSGRLEIIREAFEDGIFEDLRLMLPLVNGLNDSYSEIADLVFHILENIGDAALQVLKKSLDVKGGKGDARKIQLISKFMGLQGKEIYVNAVENGSDEVRISALRALKGEAGSENLLLEYSKERKKEVKEAALFALSGIDTDNSTGRILEIFGSKDRSLAVESIRNSRSEKLTSYVLEQAEKALESLLEYEKTCQPAKKAKKDENLSDKTVDDFYVILQCLEGKKSAGVMAFYEKCLVFTKQLDKLKINRPYEYNQYTSISEAIAKNIFELGTAEAAELLEGMADKYDNLLISYVFASSVFHRDAEYVFDRYSGYLKKGKKSYEGDAIIKVFDELADFKSSCKLYSYDYYYYKRRFKSMEKGKIVFDKRWVKLFMEIDEEDLVCRLADEETKGIEDYLVKKIRTYKDTRNKNVIRFFQGLLQAGHTDIVGLVKEVLDADLSKYNYYNTGVVQVLRLLPPERVKEVEELALSVKNESTSRRIFEIAQLLKA